MNRLLRQLGLSGLLGGLPQHPPSRTPLHPADPADPAGLGGTSRCPLGQRCTGCGRGGGDLAVHVFDLYLLGVCCLTLCPTCAASAVPLGVGLDTAVTLVLQHAEHVGVHVATEELLQRRFHRHDGQLLCRPRARTGPVPGSAIQEGGGP